MTWKDILRKGDAWEMEQTYGMSSADIVDMFADENLDREEPDWESLHGTADWIYSQVLKMENAQLEELAKEYVGIWVDLETNEEKEDVNTEKMKPLQKQINDLLKRTLPDFIKSQNKDLYDGPPTDEEYDYFFNNYLGLDADDMFWYLTSDIVGYQR
tara:strand:- start:161 stop:631 length:471 start_codon:yes stop_codon:yes gene_type:complete